MSTPVYCRPEAYSEFRQSLAELDTTSGLFHAAFAIALHERPEASWEQTETIVENLAITVLNRVQSRSGEARLAHLHDVLFDVFGLQGNRENYYHPSNSYLPNVLHTRRGIPITLVLIYKRVAEPLGLTVHGINSPGHFLAEVVGINDGGKNSMFVDPFAGGTVLDEREVFELIAQTTGQSIAPSRTLLERATPRGWLSRMLMNLQASFAASGQQRNVCAMQELQALL